MDQQDEDALLRALEEDVHAGDAFVALATAYLTETRDRATRVFPSRGPHAIAARFAEALPRGGQPLEAVLARLRDEVIADANHLYHPRYVGHQVSPPLPAAIWTEPLIGALNQSVAVWEMSPVATMVEHQVIRWMCELAGYGAGSGGTFTSGGTEATLAALLAARARAVPEAWTHGMPAQPPVIVYGEHAHYAVTRAAGVMGVGIANCVAVPSRAWQMDVDALRDTLDQLARDGRAVLAVMATAGSTPTGSFDDLAAVADLCDARGLWLHVDAAHGGSALLSASHRERLRGIARAASIAWDPHKMMLLPLSAGMVLVREERMLDAALAQKAPYLFHGGDDAERVIDQGVRSLLCSRRADVLKLWVALQRYGADGIGVVYDRLCAMARAMWATLSARADFVVLHEPESNILCFRWTGDGTLDDAALDALNLRLREAYNRSGHGWITTTVLHGRRVLRVTIMNPRTTEEDLTEIVERLGEMGREMGQETGQETASGAPRGR